MRGLLMMRDYRNYYSGTVHGTFPHTLSEQEQQRWQVFCQQRLTDPVKGAPLTLDGFMKAAQELSRSATPAQLKLLDEWQRYAVRLSRRLGLAEQGQDQVKPRH